MISLASEITDGKGRRARGWLFFDAECAFCTRMAGWLAEPMRHYGLAVAPLQDPRVGALLGLSRQELMRAIRFVFEDGRQYAGADALIAVARKLWWARPLVWLSSFPGMIHAMRRAYRWWAERSRCHAHHCTLTTV